MSGAIEIPQEDLCRYGDTRAFWVGVGRLKITRARVEGCKQVGSEAGRAAHRAAPMPKLARCTRKVGDGGGRAPNNRVGGGSRPSPAQQCWGWRGLSPEGQDW